MASNNPDGRPLKFESPEVMQELIDAYFKKCDDDSEYYTITGLALALDTSRRVLCEYEKKDEFSNAIKRAKLIVENDYEKSLRKRGSSGDIFGLKNFGWKDKTEVDTTLKIDKKSEQRAKSLLDEALGSNSE